MGIGNSVRTARQKAGLTQAELAAKIGVATSMIAQIELDIKALTIQRAQQIAEVLGISVQELTGI